MIQQRKGILITLAIILIFSFLSVNCARKPAQPGPGEQMTQDRALEDRPDTTEEVGEYTPRAEVMPSPEEPQAMVPGSGRKQDVAEVPDLMDVFFAFDESDLTSEGKDRLARNAR